MNNYFIFFLIFLNACTSIDKVQNKKDRENLLPEVGGIMNFKIPLVSGYNWEVTQSWAEHCELCNDKGYDEIHNSFFGDYCELSHSNSCKSKCKYAWDFNLPGNADEGKPVLASADGVVKTILYNHNAWGNAVIIDHGDNICTRSAHLLDDSMLVKAGDRVCQGLKIAEIGGTPYFSPHLHFQFETCDTREPLAMGFSDGNDIPICSMGNDIFDNDGNYDLLILNNQMKESCDQSKLVEFDNCKNLQSCPMNNYCNRDFNHKFQDHYDLDYNLRKAAEYLWYECAIDENEKGEFDKNSKFSRAEGMKSVVNAFGFYRDCDSNIKYTDINSSDWFYEYIVCAIENKILLNLDQQFYPNAALRMPEAVTLIVVSAIRAGLIELAPNEIIKLNNIDNSHWSYKYFQTLYNYGFNSLDLINVKENDKISKGDFAIMISSLIPCFCANVNVPAGEICDQESFSCVEY